MRASAVRMMLRGEATALEIAKAADVSRQLVYYWARCAGLGGAGKVQETRRAWVRNRLVAGVSRTERPISGSKGRMRKVADKAKAEWDLKRHAENPEAVGN